MIRTVRGDISPECMGITMSHEHLCVDLSKVRNNTDSTFGYESEVIEEVEKAKSYGVKSFVEVSCNDMGRNVLELKKIAEACDIHIVASTGFYLQEYHPEWIKEKTAEEIAQLFIHELTVGMDATDIKAGVIGEVASSEVMSHDERKVLQAAAIAAKEVGCAVTTHCQMGKLGFEHAELFLHAGMHPEKVILGHIDLSNDVSYMLSLLEKGFNLGFDTIGKENYLSDAKRADTLCTLLEKGYGKQIVLSQDISRRSYFSNQAHRHGYTTVMKTFLPRLLERGVDQQAIDELLTKNPQRIFNME